MLSKKVIIRSAYGIHMRPAGLLVKELKNFPDSEVTIKTGDKEINAKSVMQLMGAGIKKDSEIEIIVKGGNEAEVLEKAVSFMESKFDE